jgi:hypothetical protein
MSAHNNYGSILFLLLVVFLYPITHASIIVLNPHPVVQAGDVDVLVCADSPLRESSHKIQVLCDQQGKILSMNHVQMNETCLYATTNITSFVCDNARVRATVQTTTGSQVYSVPIKITKQLIEPTHILASQSWDGGWGSAEQTAYAIWVLSAFNQTYELQIQEGLEWLKQNRGTSKCFLEPGFTSCSVKQTTKALAYLLSAGINQSNRLVQDAVSVVESYMNVLDDKQWQLTFTGIQDNISCNMSFNNQQLFSQEVVEDQMYSVSVTPTYDGVFNISCSDEFHLTLKNGNGIELISSRFDEDTTKDFDLNQTDDGDDDENQLLIRIPFACVRETPYLWDACSIDNSVFALVAPLTQQKHQALLEWVDTQFVSHAVAGTFLESTIAFELAPWYLQYVSPKESYLKWLVYSQQNDGSFGGDIVATAQAVWWLQNQSFPQKDEVLFDATHYISTKYTGNSYKDTRIDGGIFQVLSRQSLPFVSYQQGVLLNPTRFNFTNLTYVYDASAILVQGPSYLEPGQSAPLSIANAKTTAGFSSSKIVISQQNIDPFTQQEQTQELKQLYASFTTQPILRVVQPKTTFNTYNGQVDFSIDVQEINTPVPCTQQWNHPLLSYQSSITLDSTGIKMLEIQAPSISEGRIVATGLLSCTVGTKIQTIELLANFTFHKTFPLAISVQKITQIKPFTLKNTYGEPVQVRLSSSTNSVELSPLSATIAPGEKITIQVISSIDQKSINESQTVLGDVTVQVFDTAKQIPVVVTIEPQKTNSFIWIFLGVFGIGMGGFCLFFWKDILYHLKKMNLISSTQTTVPGSGSSTSISFKGLAGMFGGIFGSTTNTTSSSSNGSSFFSQKTATKKSTIQNQHYMIDVISIMKSMDKSEKDIYDSLSAEGFDKTQIADILAQLTSIEKRLDSIKHEETVLGIIKSIDANIEVIAKVLKDKGYSESAIHDALVEISKETEQKEQKLKEEAGVKEKGVK